MAKFLPHVLAGAIVAGLFGTTGCYTHAAVATPAVEVSATAPALAMVAPNVWVVQGYSEPVFYADNGYWLYRNGLWYRSHYYGGGWVRAYYTPIGIRTHIRNPYRWRYYRARRGIAIRRAPRIHRANYIRRYNNRRAVRHNNRVIRHNNRVIRRNNRVIRHNNRVIRQNRKVKKAPRRTHVRKRARR